MYIYWGGKGVWYKWRNCILHWLLTEYQIHHDMKKLHQIIVWFEVTFLGVRRLRYMRIIYIILSFFVAWKRYWIASSPIETNLQFIKDDILYYLLSSSIYGILMLMVYGWRAYTSQYPPSQIDHMLITNHWYDVIMCAIIIIFVWSSWIVF